MPERGMRDPYKVLGVPRSATADDIKECFRRTVKKLHPDVNEENPESALRLAELNFAYEIIGDKDKREAFDRGEIDAEGRPRRRRISYVTPVTLCVIALSIPAAFLLVRGLTQPRGIDATKDGKAVVSVCEACEDPIVTAHIEHSELRLILQKDIAQVAADAIPLGVQVSGRAFRAALEIRGLPTGMTMSAGRPLGAGVWRIPMTDIGDATIHPPQGFDGAVDLAVELRLSDNTIVDSGLLSREWPPKTTIAPAPHEGAAAARNSMATRTPIDRNAVESQLDHKQTEQLVVRGQKLVAEGDFASGRLLLQRAAEAHDPRAALALGASYDPVLLARIPMYRVFVDTSLARDWYLKAREFGSSEAQERLNLLKEGESQRDRELLEQIVGRGQKLVAEGDFASGRLLLQRAAEARDALALGASYDPVILARLPTYAAPADASLARDWYLKARELGSPEAQQRLDLLAARIP
jgi:hypothetical protein